MITQWMGLLTTLLLFGAFNLPDAAGQDLLPGEGTVRRVVDGDTVIMDDGSKIRLLGIDTPEKGEPMFEEARERLTELVGGKKVRLQSCDSADPYGRGLSMVSVNGVNANLTLAGEGLALPLLIPPCGIPVAQEILKKAGLAARRGAGLYSGKLHPVVSHLESEEQVGRYAMVRGVVKSLFKGRKAWHLNFGEDYRTDFTAVLFERGRSRYREMGFAPESLVGSEVLVIGKLKSYNGPEIIVKGPGQILVLTERAAGPEVAAP